MRSHFTIGTLGFLFASSLHAATILPPPPGEGSTLAIVEAHCPACERVSDDQDIDFSAATGYYVFAFEDRWKYSDLDYNDLIVEAWFENGVLLDWERIAKYSVARQSFGYDGVNVFTAASGDPWVATSYSDPLRNLCRCDLMASWTLPADATEVPEPGTLGLLLAGVSVASVSRYRRKFAAPRKRGRPEREGHA